MQNSCTEFQQLFVFNQKFWAKFTHWVSTTLCVQSKIFRQISHTEFQQLFVFNQKCWAKFTHRASTTLCVEWTNLGKFTHWASTTLCVAWTNFRQNSHTEFQQLFVFNQRKKHLGKIHTLSFNNSVFNKKFQFTLWVSLTHSVSQKQ